MYKRNGFKWLKHFDFLLIDVLALTLSFVIGYFTFFRQFAFWHIRLYQVTFIVLILLNIVFLSFGETFRNVLKRSDGEEFYSTLRHWALLMLCHVLFLVMTKEIVRYPRRVLLTTILGYLILSYGLRLLRKHHILKNGTSRKRSLLILTSEKQAVNDIERIKKNNYSGYLLTGICILDKKLDKGTVSGIPIVADKDNLVEFAIKNWIDEVYISDYQLGVRNKNIVRELVDAGITTHIALKRLSFLDGSAQMIEKVGGEYAITSALSTMTSIQSCEKRVLDIVGGLVGSVITLILIPFIGYKIKKADPGPIFYSAQRVGQNGKVFKMYKFRSMVMNADELKASLQSENTVKDGMMFKIDHDPRIIGGKNGIGEFIRKTSIDEFPQFFNVLLGQMSLVGTRPPTLDEWEKYKPRHRARLSSKPGITGLWQVSGRSDIKDFEEVVKLDREYITNWSIWADIRILFKTVAVVLKKDGSY